MGILRLADFLDDRLLPGVVAAISRPAASRDQGNGVSAGRVVSYVHP